MPKTINVLFLAAEAEPFIKVGGLGDVAGSLPRALRAQSSDELTLDVRLVLPYHPALKVDGLKPLGMFSLHHNDAEVQGEAYEAILNGMPVYLVGGEPIRANGSVYSLDSKLDAEKYTFFSLAALELPKLLNWTPSIIHGNDWHTALTLYGALTKRWEEGAPKVASLITLHNLPFMGPDVSSILDSYGVKRAQTDLPEWARGMPLPLGLWASDAIVAVSPTYGKEILTAEYGCGLDEFLQFHHESIHGIINGLDVVSFNPAEDPSIGMNFDLDTIEKRSVNKGILQEKAGLLRDDNIPLLAIVSRMDIQKGIDIALAALKSMKNINFQAVILGTGDQKLEEASLKLQELFPEKIKVETRYDSGLARQIYAGADILLMPSRYEPCGLSQMIAMRYGCVPIVRAAGGLNDTVKHGVTGFVFEKIHHLSLAATIKNAIKVYSNREKWLAIQRAGMAQDFSWENSAKQYIELYQSILKQ
jgi:starch synthase